ncbi:MAG TPA: S8/S53 family peptidase, partial [Pilimelia sp.]|nr:S8/S53 family peptidase [Pilimelia sp.]
MPDQNAPQDRPADDPSRLVDEQVHNHNTEQLADAEPGVLTAYRTDVLLLPTAAIADIGGLNALLAGAGLRHALGDPLPGGAGRFTPVRVAAGTALTVWGAIRAQASGRAAVAAVASGASPDRLVSADTLTVAAGGPAATGAGSKQGHGDLGRVPVSLNLPAPPWRPFTGRRRPVVAVLDTGVDSHRWWADAPADDRFVVDAEEFDGPPGPSPVTAQAGGVGRYTGHGTFIAGLIRQQAPAARVLSVRIMHDDGVVYASDVLRALTWLRDGLGADTPERVADVVVMAFGYR